MVLSGGGGGSGTSWMRVASGVRLVVSAVVEQSTKETTTAAQRIVFHGTDLTSQAKTIIKRSDLPTHIQSLSSQVQHTLINSVSVSSSLLSPDMIWSTLRNFVPNDDTSSSIMTVKSGTAPYESQLRKKKQRESPQEQTTAIDLIINNKTNNDNNNNDNDNDLRNPYLFHQPRSPKAKTATIVAETESITTPEDTIKETTTGNRTTGTAVSSINTVPSFIHRRDEDKEERIQQHDDNNSRTENFISEIKEPILTTNSITASPPTSTLNSHSTINDGYENSATISGARLEEGPAVPSTRIGRAFGFATLGAGLAWGAIGEASSRLVGRGSASSSNTVADTHSSNNNVLTTDANADRLAATLCRMRGAALKMGQMLSIQDEALLPPPLVRALKQVRQGADAMPKYQLLQQLQSELGDNDGTNDNNDTTNWRAKFVTFDDRPFAAASIGQVHHATIRDSTDASSNKTATIPVVVKVQYPGVAQSIESDIGNLAMIVKMTGLAPKGLFIDNVMRVGRDELKVECNYINEMANQETFQSLVSNDKVLRENKFVVPKVYEELTTVLILTTGYAPGKTIDHVQYMNQEERNRIGRTLLYLTMQELFEWKLMQTDPNWGNFLYDPSTRITSLIDFGATREFPQSFVDGYLRIVWASANRDKTTLLKQSHTMGFLTGNENEEMIQAHILSGFTVGEPFAVNNTTTNDNANDEQAQTQNPFDFQKSQISTRMGEHTSVFLRHRLT